jgi:hypothetical protein
MAHVHTLGCYAEIYGLACPEWHKEVVDARKELQQCVNLLAAEESNANLVISKLEKIQKVLERCVV